MKRATGPGKFEEIAPRETSSATERLIAFRLFNFDIEDATLKREHERFLGFLLLDQLAFKGVFVSLRGEASLTGSRSFNQKLSEERVDNVRKFLLDNGVPFSKIDARHITATAGGDRDARAAGETEGTEDERFRAVLVTLHFPTLNRPPHFEDVFRSKEFGFDDSLLFEPPSVLVRPEEGFRNVKLVNGAGLTLRAVNPRLIQVLDPRTRRPLARVSTSPQDLRLQTTGFVGETELQARDAKSAILARLRVMVLPRLTVPIAFHYVRNPGIGTRRQPGREKLFTDHMDSIYLFQANIVFRQIAPPRELVVKENLGPEVQADDNKEWDAIVKHRNPGARVNVFFVREVEKDAEGTLADGKPTDTADGVAKLGSADCMVEDDIDDNGEGDVTAHEAGHCLGVDHDDPIPTTSDMLMFPNVDGAFIPRIHALRMRRGVNQRTA